MELPILSVSELNRKIKSLLEFEFELVYVEGEISNYHHHQSSGHVYFDLKDERSKIRCAFFRSQQHGIDFKLEDGQKVLVVGSISVYEPRGEYQILVMNVSPKGIGSLLVAFEQLKKRLEAEGLFKPEHKRKLPFLPQRIGVVTSLGGAVIHDITMILDRRFPNYRLLIRPASMQGDDAKLEICQAIDELNSVRDIEVIILARGGGSLEDLWPFNTEEVARSIYNSKVPVISAIGHEVDYSISDFVADLRAPTPSAAAEIVLPNKSELGVHIQHLYSRLINAMKLRESTSRKCLEAIVSRSVLRRPQLLTTEVKMSIDLLADRLNEAIKRYVSGYRERCMDLRSRLRNLNPEEVLSRGYSITSRLRNGKILMDSAEVDLGENVKIILYRGGIVCEVNEKE
ncbi:MAG: exodeoxyribonuclease VII large subunit [Actinobacteria bacterium]|nr:exodeoxyribonuclease VII large subunit [Actinomycetota bacterium]